MERNAASMVVTPMRLVLLLRTIVHCYALPPNVACVHAILHSTMHKLVMQVGKSASARDTNAAHF